ncbi:FCD domain-containing protein [Rhodobacteraceae bacterium RKSG542]|uniref:FCD domain-containing protein n=1 Tax=Pseudovibrio flavus TaxID=2529854 RepID=UPI0012BC89DD|nr:FCD domain-containing protein [Pseudovibrio flavus]MTI16465.1 FCD domain-containing protein [Pseudovibrio flavus]
MQHIAQVEGAKTSDTIAKSLISDIRSGTIAIDSPLPTERELCERFGASRPTVREALLHVQIEGYASVETGRRPRAAHPSLSTVLGSAALRLQDILGADESIAHMEQVRQFIECGAIREATRKANNVQIAKIRQALEANYQTIGTPEFKRTDLEFHHSLIAVVGNEVILALYDKFAEAIMSSRRPVSDQKNYDRLVYEEHRAMYEAILVGDANKATEVMEYHLERSYRARLTPPPKVDSGP